MKEKGAISRKQFLTGGASVVFGALLGKLSGDVCAEEAPQKDIASATEKEWDQLPIDILPGACLISDSASPEFGGTMENPAALLTQYIHVYPGLEIMLSCATGDTEMNSWIGYSRGISPVSVLQSGGKKNDGKKAVVMTVPENVYFLRGSCANWEGQPRVWVKNVAAYALACGLGRPDLSSYTEITRATIYQHTRNDGDGKLDEKTEAYPSLGDVFFTPIGTDIIVTFNNANIVPYIHCGENYMSTAGRKLFTRCCGFGYSWYHCKTTEVCNWLGACYETVNGCAKPLTLTELQAADPHLYIRFPSRVTHTMNAALIRTKGVKNNHERLFTVVHLTDTHGDMDSTHAAYEYADQIGANFVALTGDYVPYCGLHGYNFLHSIIRKAKTPTVFSLGNHDVYYQTDQKVYEKSIAPIRDALRASEEHIYYYRDFNDNGEFVRVISLYPFDEESKNRWSGYYTQKQLLWLCEAMATVPDGGHLLILRHFAHQKPIHPDDGQLMFYDYADSTDTGISWIDMGADPVINIVDAYNRKEKIYAVYKGKLKNGEETISVEYDFSNRPNSEFVAYFVGHVHLDAVGYARNTQTKQAVLCSLCTTGVKGSEEYHSYTALSTPRDYGTDSQIALNVFAFDFVKKSIYVARVGNGLFNDREKTWMELPYGI